MISCTISMGKVERREEVDMMCLLCRKKSRKTGRVGVGSDLEISLPPFLSFSSQRQQSLPLPSLPPSLFSFRFDFGRRVRWPTSTRLIRPPRFSLPPSKLPRRLHGPFRRGFGSSSSFALGSGGERLGTRSRLRTRWEGTRCE